ncbi:MAG: LytTR family DNA-binding domain-containing protein [Bacteroidota bacterium]
MMTCIIVDDDEMARASLESLCTKIEELKVVKTCENGLDAMKFLKSNNVDLVFLDIDMPDFTGMDLVKSVDNLPQIIFTTGHLQYALEAFEYHVTDFIPKPIEFRRLLKAVERAKELQTNVDTGKDLQNDIYVRVDGRYIRLDFEDILYIESLGDYVTFITNSGKHIVHSTLKNIDEKIKSEDFLKVHRSYIVNLTKIVDIEETNLVIKDKVIPVSRAHRPVLMQKIKTI